MMEYEDEREAVLMITEACNSNCIMCPMSSDARKRGNRLSEKEAEEELSHLREDTEHIDITGGEPFLNTGILIPLVKRIRKELPNKDIWSWTGYTWEEMMLETPDKLELLSLIDILVDGRYDKSKRNLMLQFRGSSNQRIIDVQKSLKAGKVIIWDRLNDGTESFEQVNRDKTE